MRLDELRSPKATQNSRLGGLADMQSALVELDLLPLSPLQFNCYSSNSIARRRIFYASAHAARSDRGGNGLRYPDMRSLDLEILRRGFSAVAYDLILDLLAFIERRQPGPLDSRNMHEHILPAALRLD